MIFLAALLAAQVSAQDTYSEILNEYKSGDPTAALHRLAGLGIPAIDSGFESLVNKLSPALSQTAAAMHTAAALRPVAPTGLGVAAHHLALATAIIEYEQPVKGKLARPLPRSGIWPVTTEFRRLWYVTVVTSLESTAQLASAKKYLEAARELYPDDADVLLLSAIADEMLASPRTDDISEGARRKALEQAERYLRAAVAAAPGRLEAQLRLGRVLYLRGDPSARTVLESLSVATEPRLRYLSALFLGAVCDSEHDAVAAQSWYAKAMAELPDSQAAALALSELRYRTATPSEAAALLPSAIGERNESDPWWSYVFGEHWRAPILLDALRRMRQR
jgi:tetratricopeptide (TPR) repeat protein